MKEEGDVSSSGEEGVCAGGEAARTHTLPRFVEKIPGDSKNRGVARNNRGYVSCGSSDGGYVTLSDEEVTPAVYISNNAWLSGICLKFAA